MAQQTQTVIITGVEYGPDSQRITCPYCHSQVYTVVRSQTSRKTHIIAILLCLLGCCVCAFIPYCMDNCKNKNHYCPTCGAYLGTYKD